MSYKNIVHVYKAKGRKFAHTVERLNQHGSKVYSCYDITGKDWKEGMQINNREFSELRCMASTQSPYKRPLKAFKRKVMMV